MSQSRFAGSMLLVGVTVMVAAPASAQHYPNKPIRILTSSVGGSSDFSSRRIAQEISVPLGQPVIVENRGEFLSIEAASKSQPDGYTLLQQSSVIWLTPFLRDNVSWDPVRDFSPVTSVERSPNLLVVHPSLPVNSVNELVAMARSKPGTLNYASAGAGGSSHLAGELFKSLAGVNIVRVAYKGGTNSILAVVTGEVQLAFSGAGSATPHVKAGRLRALAVTGSRPSTLFPALPMVAESGLPGYAVESMDAIFVPTKTPAAVIKRLNQEIVKVLNRADLKERLLNIGVEVASSSPEELAATVKSEMAKWSKLIKDAGIKAE